MVDKDRPFLFIFLLFFPFFRVWFCACCPRVNVTVTVVGDLSKRRALPITLRHVIGLAESTATSWAVRKECESRNERYRNGTMPF